MVVRDNKTRDAALTISPKAEIFSFVSLPLIYINSFLTQRNLGRASQVSLGLADGHPSSYHSSQPISMG